MFNMQVFDTENTKEWRDVDVIWDSEVGYAFSCSGTPVTVDSLDRAAEIGGGLFTDAGVRARRTDVVTGEVVVPKQAGQSPTCATCWACTADQLSRTS